MTRRGDGGMATAELAVVLPVLVLLVAAGLTAISVLLAQLRCVDGAREAARAAARGEPTRWCGLPPLGGTRSGGRGGTGADDVRVTVTATAGRGGGPYRRSG